MSKILTIRKMTVLEAKEENIAVLVHTIHGIELRLQPEQIDYIRDGKALSISLD